MYAETIGNLSSRELRRCPYPVILHVKYSADSKDYDHFELFLGSETGRAKLFNPPQPVRLVEFYELAPRWDGTGLLVSAEPIDIGVVFASARKRLILQIAGVIAVIFAMYWARRKWALASVNSRGRLLSFSIAQAAGFMVLALLFGMVYHFANKEGFLAHANATTSIEQTNAAKFMPKVGKSEVNKLLDSNTVFIDARYSTDFAKDHIKGAINVPVNLCDKGCKAALANIDKQANIVVYCQSTGCKFAENIAVKLKADGFTNISIYKGGWNEWQEKSGVTN